MARNAPEKFPAAWTELYGEFRVLRRRLANEHMNDDLDRKIKDWRQRLDRAKTDHPDFTKNFVDLEVLLMDDYPTKTA